MLSYDIAPYPHELLHHSVSGGSQAVLAQRLEGFVVCLEFVMSAEDLLDVLQRMGFVRDLSEALVDARQPLAAARPAGPLALINDFRRT